MSFNGNIIPWRWGKKEPEKAQEKNAVEKPLSPSLFNYVHPFSNLFHEFDNALMMPLSESNGMFFPRVEMKEGPNDLQISVELPGVDEKDIEVSVRNNELIVEGEKREEREHKTQGYYKMERHYGSFRRSIPFPMSVDTGDVNATFKNGLLIVSIPKLAANEGSRRKIEISKS